MQQRLDTGERASRSQSADYPPPSRGRELAGAREYETASPPLVTVRLAKQRVVIAAADPAATALGLFPGMPLTQAKAMVPGLDVRDADPAGDTHELKRIALFAIRRWTPTAQVDEPDGLLMDLTGVAHLYGGEAEMAHRILALCRRIGLSARIAIAGTAGAAYALARYGPEAVITCPVHGELDALASLPVDALRLDERQRNAAARLGIERVADLVAMPRAPLSRRFGATLLTRLDQAIGRVAEPLDGITPVVVPEVTLRFAEPIGVAETIGRALAELANALSQLLRNRGLGVRVLRLICERVDREEQVVTVGTARGTRDVAHLLRLLAMKIETIDPGFGIERMHLVAVCTEPLGPVALDADLGGVATPDLALLIDQIVARLGRAAIFKPIALESDVPERSVARVGPLDNPLSWPALWPRPARILKRPERIENVLAGLPDHPPKRFAWRGATHTVICADGPERIRGEWWRRPSEARAVRDYFRVENERGERFWVFRRGDGEDPQSGDLSWHIHGIFG